MSNKMTEYPAFPFTGEYYSEAEIAEIHRRADKRATSDGTIPDEIRRAPMRAVSRDVVLTRKTPKGKSA